MAYIHRFYSSYAYSEPMHPFWYIPFLLLTYMPQVSGGLATRSVNLPTEVPVASVPVPKAPNTGASPGAVAQAATSPTGYFPKASPSSNYVVPGDTVSFSGNGFAAGESVTLFLGTQKITSWAANGSGSFTNAGSYNVPFALKDSSRYFSVVGSVSKYPISINVVVGTFYPTLTPSTYLTSRGSSMTAEGENFAPHEPVTLTINNSTVLTNMANAQGNVSWTFGVPQQGIEFRISAVGLWSNTHASQTVTLAP